MQSSYADGRWNVTLQAWIGTKGAATALIKTLEVARDILPDALADDVEAVEGYFTDRYAAGDRLDPATGKIVTTREPKEG